MEIQYADYAYWEGQVFQSESIEKQLGYWKNELEHLPKLHHLPLDFPRPVTQSYQGNSWSQCWDKDRSNQLYQFAQEQKVTLFVLMHTVFVCLLYKLSRNHDIVIGTPVANRQMKEVEPLVGFFVNNLVLRTKLSNDLTFLNLLEQCKSKTLTAFENQHVPYELLIKELKPLRDASYNPLFQIFLSFQNNENVELNLEGLSVNLHG